MCSALFGRAMDDLEAVFILIPGLSEMFRELVSCQRNANSTLLPDGALNNGQWSRFLRQGCVCKCARPTNTGAVLLSQTGRKTSFHSSICAGTLVWGCAVGERFSHIPHVICE